MLTYIFFTMLVVAFAALWQMDSGQNCIMAEEVTNINSPRHTIYAAISDLPAYSRWHPGLGQIKPLDKSQVHIGKEYVETANLPQGETNYTLVVSGHTPDSFFSFTTDSIMENVHEFNLELNEGGFTVVRLRIVSRKRSYLFHYVVAPPLKYFFTSQVLQTLFNLRQIV